MFFLLNKKPSAFSEWSLWIQLFITLEKDIVHKHILPRPVQF